MDFRKTNADGIAMSWFDKTILGVTDKLTELYSDHCQVL